MVSANKIRIVRKAQESFAPKIRIVTQKTAAPEPPKEITAHGVKYLRFDAHCSIEKADGKSFDIIKDGERVVDYQNVRIKGYLSTFGNVDRDGEVMLAGAFKNSIAEFLKNPVMLADHTNKIEKMVGSFQVVREDAKGLWVEGTLSNSPSEFMRHTRCLVAEQHLKTLSVGGFMAHRGHEITDVQVLEGSLVSIPANARADFSVRECTELEVKRWKFEARNPAE